MRILIVKLSSIGDVIHTLPVVPAIRAALPNAEISWVVEKGSAEILRGNKLLTNLIEVDTKSFRTALQFGSALRGARGQLRSIRTPLFDVAIDFQGLLKSAGIAKLSKAKRRYGFSREYLREPASRFLLTETFDAAPQRHVIAKNLMLAHKALKISVPEKNFEFPIFTDASHRDEAAKIAARAGEKFALLNPAGGWVTKLWPAEKFGQLADKLWEEFGLTSVISYGPNERKLAEKASSACRSCKAITASASLKGFYELAKRATVYVGGDTGPTHLAVAAGAPVVGIFGPTEWWRNGSPTSADICVERNDIDCRVNCHRRTCNNWICMDIEVETVLAAVRKRLEKSLRVHG